MSQRLSPILVKAPQRSDEWFAARLGNATGSRISDTIDYLKPTKMHIKKADEFYALNKDLRDEEWIDIMREQYPVEYCLQAYVELSESSKRIGYRQSIVAERITGRRGDTDPYVTEDMKWGIVNEGFAKSLYQVKYRNLVEEAPLMLHPTLLCGASPDGLVTDMETGELGNLEVKCLKSSNHLYKVILKDDMPSEYNNQVQMQMWINGRDWCDFVAYDSRVKEGLQLFVKRIEYDEFYVTNVLEPGVTRFLDECDKEERVFYAIMKARQKQIDEIPN